MSFTINYNSLEKLYADQLMLINKIKFTFREIDLLACIVHNRGEKKIASLLSISPRTVSTHVGNIMSKLGAGSKDQIIDFIENSGKLPLLKEYYLHIRIRSNFEKQLAKIGAYINKNKVIIYCHRDDILAIDSQFLQSIQRHLKLANVLLLENVPNGSESIDYFALSKITKENYYNDLFKGLSEILQPTILDDTVGEFAAVMARIQDEYMGKAPESDSELDKDEQEGKVKLSSRATILASLGFLLVIAAFFIYGPSVSQDEEKTAVSYAKAPEIIKDLEELLLELLKDGKFTSVIITPEQAKKNHSQNSLIKKVEKLLDHKTMKDVQSYFDNTEMSSNFLTSYLYNLQALATYYMFNLHDGDRAREILLYGKELAERYINNRSNIKSDFAELQDNEILSELQIVSDLPQIYTRIIYSLARTYVYSGTSIIEGKKYFDLAKHLGKQLGLFEGYLSDISGILVIEQALASIEIKEGKVDLAAKRLKQTISAFKLMQNYSQSYILDYKPGAKVQKTIIPKESLYNRFECTSQIITNYNLLLSITKNKQEIHQYIQEISRHLGGDNALTGGVSKAANQISARKLANLYNKLGNLTIKLWLIKEKESIEVNIEPLIQNIASLLAINPESDLLNFAETIFTQAKSLSRNSEFTKADAYKGLTDVYQLKLEEGGSALSGIKLQELEAKLNSAIEKSKLINKQLRRLSVKE
jgi:DNA-binding CsgD family transcriptional regulator